MCGIGYFVGSSAATTTRRAPRLFRKRPHRRAQMWSVPNVYAGSVTLFFFPRNFSSDGYVELGFCLEIVELRRRRLVHNIVLAISPRLFCQTQECPAQVFKLGPLSRITLALCLGQQLGRTKQIIVPRGHFRSHYVFLRTIRSCNATFSKSFPERRKKNCNKQFTISKR